MPQIKKGYGLIGLQANTHLLLPNYVIQYLIKTAEPIVSDASGTIGYNPFGILNVTYFLGEDNEPQGPAEPIPAHDTLRSTSNRKDSSRRPTSKKRVQHTVLRRRKLLRHYAKQAARTKR